MSEQKVSDQTPDQPIVVEDHGVFALAIGCIDGREGHPVSEWIKRMYPNVDHIDNVKAPGTDGLLSGTIMGQLEVAGVEMSVEDRVKALQFDATISLTKHHPKVVIVSGHIGCAGNPVSREEHINQIKLSIKTVKGWGILAHIPVHGLYVSTDPVTRLWVAEEIKD